MVGEEGKESVKSVDQITPVKRGQEGFTLIKQKETKV